MSLCWTAAGLLTVSHPGNAQTIRADFDIADGPVYAEVLSGNTLYLGGRFSHIGPVTGGGTPLDAVSGVTVPGFPRVTGQVYAVAPDGDGGWFVGGSFTSVGGLLRSNAAHILADNSVSDWNPGPNGPVRALVLNGPTLFVGGEFTSIADSNRSCIAALDAATGLATVWNPGVTGGYPLGVYALAVSGAWVYAGGNFFGIGGANRYCLAALDSATGLATAWNPMGGPISALSVGGSNLYVGGYFASMGGAPRSSLAAVDLMTGQATAWNPNPTGGSPTVVSTVAANGTKIYVGGNFTSIGGANRNYIAAVSATSGLATAWDPNAGGVPYPRISALLVSGPTVYAGGRFAYIGGESRNNIAALDASSGLASNWDPAAYAEVNALAISGATVYAGGVFSGMGGAARRNIAAVDATIGHAMSWNPGADDAVLALAVADGLVYVGGDFTTIGEASRNRIAAIDSATGAATAWDPDANGTVSALAPDGNTIIAGGSFDEIGHASRPHIAALNVASGLATVWNPDANSPVYAVAVGDHVYAGGDFTSIGGAPRSGIAALDRVTGLATDWDPWATGGAVHVLAVRQNLVYVAGDFTGIGAANRHAIAALDVATGLATSWNPNAGDANPTNVRALAIDGSIVYAGGQFNQIGGQLRSNIAALDASTGMAIDWDPGASDPISAVADPTVSALAVGSALVYAGGSFPTMGGLPLTHFASIAKPQVSVDAPFPDRANAPTLDILQNPTSGDNVPVAFGVRAGASASLELLDISGHCISRQSVSGSSEKQFLNLAKGHALRPTIYFVRLRESRLPPVVRKVCVLY